MPWGRRVQPSLNDPKGDQRVIDTLVKLGADLSQRRHLRAHLYFPSEASATAAADQLAADNVQVEVRKHKRNSWLALVETDMVVSEGSIKELGDVLRAVASDHGGSYSGWEASPQP